MPGGTLQQPNDTAAVLEAVKDAIASERTIEIVGAGTKRGLGRPAAADGTCDLRDLSGITLYEPEELVLTAKAGTRLSDIERALAEAKQHLAFEPLDLGPLYGGPAGRQTIGGVLACNLSGPRRIGAGAARDHFLGFEAVTGHGEVIKAGGRVVKNVTGYDLGKLFAGSYGTLGTLTQVTVKVLPAPEHQVTAIVKGLTDAEAVALMRAAVGNPFEISGAVHLPKWAVIGSYMSEIRSICASMTAIRLEGFAVSIDDRTQRLGDTVLRGRDVTLFKDEDSKRFWADIRALGPASRRPDDYVWRLSVPPAQGAEVAAAIKEQIAADVYYDWSGGLIWCLVPALGGLCEEPIRAAVEVIGGHATIMRAPEHLRAEADVFHPLSEAKAALVGRIKTSFDPDGIFNPGRMYAGE